MASFLELVSWDEELQTYVISHTLRTEADSVEALCTTVKELYKLLGSDMQEALNTAPTQQDQAGFVEHRLLAGTSLETMRSLIISAAEDQ